MAIDAKHTTLFSEFVECYINQESSPSASYFVVTMRQLTSAFASFQPLRGVCRQAAYLKTPCFEGSAACVMISETDPRGSRQPGLMTTEKIWYTVVVLALRVALVVAFAVGVWFVYQTLPNSYPVVADQSDATTVEIVLRRDQKNARATDGLPVQVYPIDIVAVRHEFFAERRAGERFDDFLKQRMKGRSPVSGKFDAQGEASVSLPPGNWWIHATIPGEEEIEWRLPVTVGHRKQVVELTPQNAYLRSKSF